MRTVALYEPAWPRGRTSVLRSLGNMFDSPRGRRNFFSLRQLRPALRCFGDASGLLVLWAILNSLSPGVSVIAPLLEQLPGLIEGSLRPQSSFEYSVPGS